MINDLIPQQNCQVKRIPVFAHTSFAQTNDLHTDNVQTPPNDANQQDWQSQINTAITDLDELLALLDLEHLRAGLYVPSHFRLKVPRGFVAKMQVGNADDPLLKQILPDAKEQQHVTGFVTDPLDEINQNPNKGLLHKYKSRVLLTLTGACAVHCRYCFRQHFDYNANLPTSKEMQAITDYISAHPEINEVIFSGGDPLSLNNRRLFAWFDAIESLPQIRTIRLHTRLPIVIPERLDDQLVARLASSRCHIVMVVHVNHANEIDAHTAHYLRLLKQHGITALNQTVFLKGVNDDADTLSQLSWQLFEADITPYYLHLLDKVAGSAHFFVDERSAVATYWQLLEDLPGYLVPKLVQEIAGKPFKTPVNIHR